MNAQDIRKHTRANSATIIASTFSCDAADIRDARYQPTRYRSPVYAISDRYFTVSQTTPKIAGFVWRAHTDQFFAKLAGTTLWVALADEEAQS